MVWRYNTTHNISSKSKNCLDYYLAFVIGDRIDAKHDAGRVRLNHFLDWNGNAYCKVIKFLLMSIENCPRTKKGSPCFFYFNNNISVAFDIKICLLLSCK